MEEWKKETEDAWETKVRYLEGHQFNLSDFALFLSVMKHKEAYEAALSIILEEPEVKMREVKVEEVILNQYGKRAIRLDAWGMTDDNRQVNMEMENHDGMEDVSKRSRFYQSLMDTPILKSGKRTKYRRLPSSIIIFITKDDIFKKDMAKYTFTEQCEEIAGLHLGDGTKKIFLNMTSKNGSKELVSLLQYMKNTSLNNPEIESKDERIIRLDEIVTEVKESEEWEAVQMNILEIGISHGMEQGIAQGKAEAILELLEEFGEVPKDLRKAVLEETNLERLRAWLKLSAKAGSIEEFRSQAGL